MPQEMTGASKSLLEVITSAKDDIPASQSLLTALGGEKDQEKTGLEDPFKLPDLLTPEDTKEQQAELQREKVLLKPLEQPKIKPKLHSRTIGQR